MSSRWLRLNVDWDDSPWVFTLHAELQLAWIKLLCHVKRDGTGGKVKALAPLVASRKWGVGEESVTKMLQAGVNDGAIVIEDGYWVIANWAKYQEIDRTANDRKRRQRAKECHAVTHRDTVDGCHATETETETKKKTSKKSKGDFDGAELPKGLDSVKGSILEWQAYKRSRGESWKRATWERRFREFQDNPKRFKEAIERSIDNGWAGLFPAEDKPERKNARGFEVIG